MMRRSKRFLRISSALALALALAACTKGGQFDPTVLLDNDAFDSKKKLKGDRIPVFPNGVPGVTTGVPADLVKGYQAPPDQPDPDSINPPPPDTAEKSAEAEKPKPKPKPKPRPKVAVKQAQDPIWNQRPAAGPTRISVGPKNAAPPQAAGAASSDVAWPAPPSTAPAQQSAQPSQSIWPNPPAPGSTGQ